MQELSQLVLAILQQPLVKFAQAAQQRLGEIQLQLGDDVDQEGGDGVVIAFAADARRQIGSTAEVIVTINQAFDEFFRGQELAVKSEEGLMEDEVWNTNETILFSSEKTDPDYALKRTKRGGK